MVVVTLREAGIGLNYPCARCEMMFDTAQDADRHMMSVHKLYWRD